MATRIDGLPDGRPGLLTGRGTAALMAAARALGWSGREVLVPVNLCPIAIAGLVWAGVRPVLHDVDPTTGNARTEDVAALWRPGCAGVVVVHNFGVPVPVDAIVDWADGHRMTVVEDCCNAIGATLNGRPVGAFGALAIYAFGPGKIADAGGGGAVTAADPAIWARLVAELDAMPVIDDASRAADAAMEDSLRAWRNRPDAPPSAQRPVLEAYRPHAATRLDEARHGRVRETLAALPRVVAHRRAMASHWRQKLAGSPVPVAPATEGAVPWRVNIRVPGRLRDALVEALRRSGVPVSTWYPPVATLFQGEVMVADTGYPGAERFAEEVVNLWVDPATDRDKIDRWVDLILRETEMAA